MKKLLKHGTMEHGRFKAGANDLTQFPFIARQLIFNACDLETRFDLMDWAEREYDAGNLDGACMLFHAGYYLKDREAYRARSAAVQARHQTRIPGQTDAIQ